MTLALPWRRLLQRELLILYMVVFLADVVVGYVLPLFPLLARQLGASLTLIGVLTALNGSVQVVSAVPLGVLSDRWGRRHVITGGIALFAAACWLLAFAPTPQWLIPAQILLGLGIVATFYTGAALAGDYSEPSERGLVMGGLTTAMGLGFAVGPLLGGALTEWGSLRGSLNSAGVFAVLVFLLSWQFLPEPEKEVPARGRRSFGLGLLARNRALLLAALAHLLLSPIFNAVVLSFVPIQAAQLGFSALAIGTLFTLRAAASTVTRLPIGILSTPRWSHRLMLLSLALGGGALVGLASFTRYGFVALALAVEGIAYGMFLTAGQAFVSQRAPQAQRGAALGAYNMAGGLSAAVSPFLLGAVADRAGLGTVFWMVGLLALAGAALLIIPFERLGWEG
jgi:DHA1 family tetracycline resistance protein-like MFS transporter